MDWLHEILEKVVADEGKIDVEKVMEDVKKAFPLHAVPKSVFNDKAKELKIANATIRGLKKSNADNEELQNKLGEYEAEIKKLKKTAEVTLKTYALKEQLTKEGVVDPDYLIYKVGGIDKFNFDKENHPVEVGETIQPYKKDTAMAHLFRQEIKKPPYTPREGVTRGENITLRTESGNIWKEC